nr:F-box only protein 21-like [Onthophagus taurus]
MLNKIPEDILQTVIEQKSLSNQDLINLSSTCLYLRNFILQNNSLWKKQYLEKWSEIENSFQINDYFTEFRHASNIHRKVDEILINIATKFIDKEQLSDTVFEEFTEIVTSRYLNRQYTENCLREIFTDHSKINTHDVVSLKTPGNLTLKYYSLLTLHYLKHEDLKNEWIQFCSLKEEDQLLEIGIILLIQWIKPQYNVKIEHFRNLFDEMTEKVKKHLKISNPNHPLFKTNLNDLNLWRNKNIYENKFSWFYCEEILETMKQVMCEMIDFCGDEPDYTVKYPFIADVLESKEGEQITLAIIYQAIARRLGVHLQLIPVDFGCILKFVEHDTNNRKVHYVDVFEWDEAWFDFTLYGNSRCSPLMVIKKMINSIKFILTERRQSVEQKALVKRSILELHQIVDPYDVEASIQLTSYYRKHNINTSPQKKPLERHSESQKSIERSLDVKFAVGMIMKHKLHNYSCVIYNWDPFPKITINSNYPWIQAMQKNQPYYYVLLASGAKKYVEQENLTFSGDKDGLDKNPEIGRFFTHFFNNSYVPNCVLNDKFPNDSEIRMNFC